jgi:tetratricopeptide (TPR) repeat protein
MLNWLNPFKWWQILQQNHRWKVASRQFIHHYYQRDFANAETFARSMVDIATGLNKNKLRLESYYNLMLCNRELQQIELAVDYGERVLNLQRSLSTNSEDPVLVERICDLADLLQKKGKIEDAIKLYGEASTIRKRIDCDKGSKQAIRIIESLATIYMAQSNVDRAQQLLDEAQIYRRKLGLVADRKLDELESAIEQIKSRHRGEYLTDLEQWQNLMRESAKLYEKGDLSQAISVMEQALKLAAEIFTDRDSNLAINLHNLAVLYAEQGLYDQAEPLYLRALKIREAILGENHLDVAITLDTLAGLYREKLYYERAEQLYLRALKILETSLGKNHPDVAITLNNLAVLYKVQGLYERAETLYLRSLKIKETSFGENHLDVARALNNLAVLYMEKGLYDRAEFFYQRSLKIKETSLGENHPDVAITLSNLASLYQLQELYERAEPLCLRSLKITETSLGKNHPNVATALNNLASLCESKGLYDQAEFFYLRSLNIYEVSLDENHPNVATTLNNLAEIYREKGWYEQAEFYYLRALKIDETSLGKNHQNVARTLNNLATLFQNQELCDRSEHFYLRSLEILSDLFCETGHPNLVATLSNLALTYTKQLKIAIALPLFQQAVRAENNWLTSVIAINDAEQRMKDLEQRQLQLELLLALTQQYFLNDSQVVADTFNAVLSRKAQAATAEATFSQALRNHPELAPQIAQYKTYLQEIANLSHALGVQPELKDRLSLVLQQKRDLEKNLARSIPAIDLAQQVIDRQALSEILPADAFLVEFVRYRDYDFIKEQVKAYHYIAFVARHDRAGVTAIDCGLAKPIDEAIEKFRSVFANSDFSVERSGFDDMFNQPTPEQAPQDPTLPDLLIPN